MSNEIKNRNPYPGPRPFEQEEQKLFFGHEREVRELLSLIIAHRVVLLYAQSGAGKTSLLNAGLIPLLTKEEFEVLPVARVRSFKLKDIDLIEIPNIYVFNTLINWVGDVKDTKPFIFGSIVGFLKERGHLMDKYEQPLPRIIIFDQFEELFTSYAGRWKEREGFFSQVAEALKDDDLLRVLFVIREDFLASLDAYSGFLPERLSTRYRLERLRKEAACLAVEGPLRDTGYSFAKGVASSLVQQLLNIRSESDAGETVETVGEYVEPVQLQVVCQSLWQNLPPEVTIISSEHVQAFGGVDEALKDFYERAVETAEKKTNFKEKDLRNWFDNKLITPAGTRGTVFRGQEHTEGIPNSAVNVLEDQHIIRAEMRAGARWYELTHDRLIEPIRESNEVWFQHQREQEQQQEIEVERLRATEQQQRAIEQARIARRFRSLAAALASVILLAIAIGLAVYANLQRQAVKKQAKIALARQLAAQAEWKRNQGADLLPQSVLLAIESLKQYPSFEGDQALRNGLSMLPRPIKFMPHDNVVRSVEFSPDARYLVTASDDNTARVWDATSGKQVAQMVHKSPLSSITFSPDGKYLATASDDDTARIWEATSGKQVTPIAHKSSVFFVTFSIDGKYLATASIDSTAQVWEVSRGEKIAQMVHKKPLSSIAFSPDGKYLATASDDDMARVWNVTSGKQVLSLPHENSVTSIVFCRDGKYLATASKDKTARVWVTTSGKPIARMRHENPVTSVAFSPDGKYLATASWDKTARVWEATSDKQVARMTHENSVHSVAFSPDGKHLATLSEDGIAQVWEATSDEKVAQMIHESSISSVAFSPNGKYLATASGDQIVRLWEVTSGKQVAQMEHESYVSDVAFSPNGKYLATASEDKKTRVWKAISGKPVARMIHEGSVSSVAFSPDGKYLATAGGDDDGIVRVWEATSGKPVSRMTHERHVSSIVFSPNGMYLATASEDKTVRVWLWRPEDLRCEACSWLTRNLTYEEWQQYFPDEPYRKTCSKLPIHPSFMETGRYLARAGKVKDAVAIFKRAIELEPRPDLHPELEARRLAALASVIKGEEFAKQGKIKETIAAYEEAQSFDPSLEISAGSWYTLGRYGSLWGYAADVLSACEKAVELEPENGNFRDSRGIARALTGDYAGAIKDFKFFVEWDQNKLSEAELLKRQTWLQELKAGRNPFDTATLETLRNKREEFGPLEIF